VAPGGADSSAVAEQIAQLEALQAAGHLSAAEFDEAKKHVFASAGLDPATGRAAALPLPSAAAAAAAPGSGAPPTPGTGAAAEDSPDNSEEEDDEHEGGKKKAAGGMSSMFGKMVRLFFVSCAHLYYFLSLDMRAEH
jgi:hypothetical protein